VSSEVAHFRPSVDQASKNRVIYHNPKRQRGICGNTGETQKLNPSLTRRVVKSHSINSLSGETCVRGYENLRLLIAITCTQIEESRDAVAGRQVG
jgi:hypothetical protein